MDHFVRLAQQDDVGVLQLLESDARAQLARFRGGEQLGNELPAVGNQWSECIGSGDWGIFVSGFDDVVLGYLCLNLATTNNVPRIEWVYVTADARQLGLGESLVSAAIEFGSQYGAVAIDAFALPGDRETKNLFERSGLTARLLIVSKRIGK